MNIAGPCSSKPSNKFGSASEELVPDSTLPDISIYAQHTKSTTTINENKRLQSGDGSEKPLNLMSLRSRTDNSAPLLANALVVGIGSHTSGAARISPRQLELQRGSPPGSQGHRFQEISSEPSSLSVADHSDLTRYTRQMNKTCEPAAVDQSELNPQSNDSSPKALEQAQLEEAPAKADDSEEVAAKSKRRAEDAGSSDLRSRLKALRERQTVGVNRIRALLHDESD